VKKLITLFAFATLIIFSPVKAHAEDTQKAVAVLDIEGVIVNCKEGKRAADRLKKQETELQTLIQDNRKKLADLEKSLLKGGKEKMTKEEVEAAKTQFTNTAKSYQDKINQSRKSLDDSKVKLLGDIQKKVSQIAADVADERKLQVVVDRKAVVLVQEDLDISQEVLSRMDKKYP
jgi:Skp family chaperone for outer membrane proteins